MSQYLYLSRTSWLDFQENIFLTESLVVDLLFLWDRFRKWHYQAYKVKKKHLPKLSSFFVRQIKQNNV